MAGFRPGVHFQTGTTTSPPVLLLLLLLPLPSLTVANPPHIVVFIGDDVGWGDIGRRDSKLHTPKIDKLAKSGVTLKYSYMQEGGIPSRAAFFSGYYPVHLGLQHAAISPSPEAVLPLNVRILPQDLKDLNYSTHYVGKWHLGSNSTEHLPTRRGFNTFYGMYGGEADYYTHTTPSGVYDMHNDAGQQFSVDTSANGTYSTTLFTNRAIKIIKNHDKTKPLFLVVAYQAVHKPLQSSGQFKSKCSGLKNATRKIRCTKLAAMDRGIGKVLKWLRKSKLQSNLITLFISDNGGPVEEGSSNLPLQGSKGTLWEGGTRAVAILHSKKYLKKSFTWNGLMHAVDWYPTILGMAGVETELIQIDGVNNWPKILKNQESERWEFLVGWNDDTQNYAYRYDNYKLLKFPSNKTDNSYEYLLFDIDKFPNETRDLSDRSSKQCLMKMMKLKLESFNARLLPAL